MPCLHVQGHGRVEMDRVIAFGDDGLSLFVHDHERGIESGATATFFFRVTRPDMPLQVRQQLSISG